VLHLKLARRGVLSAVAVGSLLSVASAWAQPGVVLPEPQPSQILRGNQTLINQALALTEQEEITRTPVSLRVTDATMETLVEQIQRAVPSAKSIEVRKARPVRLSFDLQGVQVGHILQSAAGLAGCELHLLPGRLLVAPLSELSAEEATVRFQWRPGQKLYTIGPLKSLYVQGLATDVRRHLEAAREPGAATPASGTAPASGTVLFGSLGPELQGVIHRLGRWSMYGAPGFVPRFAPTPDTKISLEPSAKGFTLRIEPGQKSDPSARRHSLSYTVIGD
jgi:hypothetical protein